VRKLKGIKILDKEGKAKLLSATVLAMIMLAAISGFVMMNKEVSAGTPTTWYDPDWTYCKEIWIQSSKVDTTLTDYPVLIHIASDSDLASHAQADGDDILFALDNGTKLSHEIEDFNSTTGELWAFAKITSLSATSNTSIFIYYGNPSATNQQDVANVWSNGYKAVWHFNEASGNIIDRTGNGYNGSAEGTPVYHQTGKIGYAIQLQQASSEWFNITASFGTLFDGTNNFSIMAVYKPTTDDDNAVFYAYKDNLVSLVHRGDLDGDPSRWYTKQSTVAQYADTTTSHSTNNWWFDTGTYSSTSGLEVFTNGSQEGSNANHSSIDSGSYSVNTIGAAPPGSSSLRYFDGYLDEIRILTRIPSDEEISTTWNFINDPASCIVVGAEKTYGGSSLPGAPTGATATEYTKFDITLSGYDGNSRFNFSTFNTNDTTGDTTWSNSTTYGIAKITNAGVQQINLSWTKGTGATNTYIEWNTVSSWSRGAGTLLYNSTGTSATLTNVPAGATRYFELWSWNASGYSSTYATASATAGNASVTNLTIHMEDGGSGNALLPKENITLYGNASGTFASLGAFDATTGNITLTTTYAGLPLAIGDNLYFEFKSVIGPGAQPNGTYYDKNAETLDCYVYAWR